MREKKEWKQVIIYFLFYIVIIFNLLLFNHIMPDMIEKIRRMESFDYDL